MSNEQRDMNGVVFRNDRKENDRQPGYTGYATINGVEYWMDAWVKDGRNGRFFSFSFKPKNQAQFQPSRQTKANFSDELSDEIPFAPEFR